MSEDHRLLGEFCRNGSEAAFRAVVDRHLKLVYSAAMRIVNGDSPLAQDISQLVFSNLARKAASLPGDVVLAGWLHRDARFTALAALRKERRRMAREQEAFKMRDLETAGAEMDWAALRPVLDEILEELNEEDRHALLLRFFEEQSLAEVGSALGLAEDAARKRVARALEKLRELLAARGITTTLAALSLLLTAHGTETVPAGLAGTLMQAVLAGAGATAGSTPGIISLLTFAKIVPLMATLAVALLLAGAVAAVFRSSSNGAGAAERAVFAGDAKGVLNRRPAPATRPRVETNNAWVAAALRGVEEALHDPVATTNFPNSAMKAAIGQLGDQKKAANSILETALKDGDAMVRMRAVDGLGIVGPEAKEATPLLLRMLEAGDLGDASHWTYYSKVHVENPTSWLMGALIHADNLILCTLGEIGSAPEILPEVAEMVKDSPSARQAIFSDTRVFFSGHQCMLGGNWLLACANGDSTFLNDVFHPLLQDGNPEVRRTAASCLAGALGTKADPGVFPVAIELLMSGDDNTLRLEGMMLLARAAEDLPSPTEQIRIAKGGRPSNASATRLGDALDETVAALTEVATKTKRDDLRTEARRLLDILNPDFRKDNPEIAVAMEQEEKLAAFKSKVQSGQATTAEMLEELKQFPKAAPAVAEALVNRGTDARAALPALGEAMSSLAPLPDASGSDRSAAIGAREQLANALQKIAPEMPKPLFTRMEVDSITRLMLDPVVRADGNRRGRISAARKAAEWPVVGPSDASPEQMRRLLAALKEADGAIYDAVAARVKEMDPLFR